MGAIESALPPTTLPGRHKLTVDDYYRMAEIGMLAPDARVELIEGEIIDMPPQRSRHAGTVNGLMTKLVNAAGSAARVTCQTPLRLSQYSEPEPDLMLLRWRADHYSTSHPDAGDVLLVIEVADATARYDREIKLPLYARHGVAEVWIVDLQARRLRVHRRPQDGEYADITTLESPGMLPLPGLDRSTIDLSGLFG